MTEAYMTEAYMTEAYMTEGYSEVQNFWNDFNNDYYEWISPKWGFECCPTLDERNEFFLSLQNALFFDKFDMKKVA